MCVCLCVYVFENGQRKIGGVEMVWIKRSVGSRLCEVLNAHLRSLACEATQLL